MSAEYNHTEGKYPNFVTRCTGCSHFCRPVGKPTYCEMLETQVNYDTPACKDFKQDTGNTETNHSPETEHLLIQAHRPRSPKRRLI